MGYFRRRKNAVLSAKLPVYSSEKINPFTGENKLKKGFRFIGGGLIADKSGNQYKVSDYIQDNSAS